MGIRLNGRPEDEPPSAQRNGKPVASSARSDRNAGGAHAAKASPPNDVLPQPGALSASSPLDTLVDALIEVLGIECRALASGDLSALHGAVARKAEIMLLLSPRLRAAPATLRTLLAPALEAARHSNEENARLLTARAVPHRARLNALMAAARGGAIGTHATYEANGQTSVSAKSPHPVVRA